MPQIGPMEIMVVAVIALIVFGPEKLPEIARTIGRYAAQVRRMANEVRSEFDLGVDDDVRDERPAPRSRRAQTRRTRDAATGDAPGEGSDAATGDAGSAPEPRPQDADEKSTPEPRAEDAADASGSEPRSRGAGDGSVTEPRSQSA